MVHSTCLLNNNDTNRICLDDYYLICVIALEWNFVKFLVNKDGKPTHRYSPEYMPLTMEPEIIKLLPAKAKSSTKKATAKPVVEDESEEAEERRGRHMRARVLS